MRPRPISNARARRRLLRHGDDGWTRRSGKSWAALVETGHRDQTAVFLTPPTMGDMLGELGLWHKSTLYEGLGRGYR